MAAVTGRTRNRWGWGFEDAVIGRAEAVAAAEHLPAMIGLPAAAPEDPVPLERVVLPAPRS